MTPVDPENPLCRNAEKSAQNAADEKAGIENADTLRLLHEVQLHKLELEMQNQELQRALTQTRLIEERYKNIVENQTELIDRYLPGGVLTYVNRALADFAGKAARDLVGSSFYQFVHEADLADVIRRIESITVQNPTVQTECRNILADGSVRWTSWSQKGFFDENGGIVEYQAVGRDITEHKLAEIALRASEARYRRLYDSIIDGFATTDMDGRLIDWNRPFEQMLGYSEEELTELEYRQFTPQQWHAIEEAIVQQEIIPKGYSGVYEKEYIRKDGTIFPVELRTYLIRDDTGRPSGMWAIVRDISERKSKEEQLKTSEERFRSIAALSPDIISIINPDGTLAYNSPASYTIHGYTDEEISGLNTFEYIHPDDQETVSALFSSLISTPNTSETVQYRYRNKDGTYTWMEATASNHLDNPLVNGVVCISRDISKRKLLEEELTKLEQHMRRVQKIESLGVLAGGIAHDFNNILTGILGNISYARRFIDENSKAAVILQSAEKAANRASDLSNQLLTFAKGGKPVKKVVSIRHLLEEAVSFVLHGSNVSCSLTIADGIPAVDIDEGQISQALSNIIINASQAMPGGGIIHIAADALSIDSGNTVALPPGRYLSITIADKGCGIPDGDLGNIFDPYFTTKAGGSGLGLATTFSIITRHGGHIGVSSRIHEGATFEILLPASNRAVDTGADIPARTDFCVDSEISVLVMDDEDVVRDMVQFMLKDQGYHVQSCVNGDEAVVMYKSAKNIGRPYSAVIMDLTIPGGMGGREAAQHILAFDPQARLIVSSGYSNDPVMAECTEYGFSAVLQKPYNEEKLSTVIRSVIAAHHTPS